ncbi:MAG: RagB/SusD family nutrient uptake outer membrane protein [Candidatus Cryptobacteroides sp.]
MKKIFQKYIVALAVILSSQSCLDKFPMDSIPMEDINTAEDINQLMIGVYSAFKSSSLYSGALTLLPDIQTDLVYAVKENNNTYGDIWRWNEIKPTNPEIESVYAGLYTVINRCNFLLDNVEKVRNNTTDDDELDRIDQYCGEACFARALAYSELIKCFCVAYDSEEQAASVPGVVITSHYNGNEIVRRSSLKDSYDFVLKDLDMAAELLDLGDDFDPAEMGVLYNTEYFNEYSCYALRARISLYMRDWTEAVKWSSKVIDSGYYFLSSCSEDITSGVSYYDYMWQYGHSTEAIWKIAQTLNSYGGAIGSVFFNYDNYSYKPDYVPATWVMNLYASADLRASAYFRTAQTGYSHGLQWPVLYKYYGNQELFTPYKIYGVCIPMALRLSEQYLIRAEAYVNLGDYANAGKDISKIRIARYSTYGGATSMNADNAMTIIEEERVKELYMEGFRLNDLKRWHKGFERDPDQQSSDYFQVSSLEVREDDPLFVWPIPQHELDSPGVDIEPNESNK